MHPVTEKIRGNQPTKAQIRALRMAALEGSLDYHRAEAHNLGRWAPPSRVQFLPAAMPLPLPYAQSGSVFALERRGLLAPDPRYQRGQLGDRPRPRVLTDAGRDMLRRLDSKLISQLAVLSLVKYNQ